MFSIWRSVLGVVVGLVVFVLIVVSVEALAKLVYPPPANLEQMSPEQMAEFMAGMPATAYLLILGGWVAGTFVGGYLAARVANSAQLIHAGTIGGLCLLFTGVNFRLLPHPEWFVLLAPLAIIAATYFAGALATPKEPDSFLGEAVIGDGSGGAQANAGGRRSA